MRAIANVWREACEQSATAHSGVMDALATKLDALLKGKRHLRRKLACATSNTTLENRLDAVRHLDASFSQTGIPAVIHREYLDTLTAGAGTMEQKTDDMLSYAILLAAQDWDEEKTMYNLKMKRRFQKNSSEPKLNAARTRYFPALAKHVIAMGKARATKESIRDLCESGGRLQQIRGAPDSVLATWEDRLTYYKEELNTLIECQKDAKVGLDALSETLGLETSEVESLQLEDLDRLTVTEDKEAFRTQISAIAESKRPKVRPPRTPRPIALLPIFNSWDGAVVEEFLPPDLGATARAGNKAVQRYLSSIGVDWQGLSTERYKSGVARQTTHYTGESGDGKVTLDQMRDLDQTWQLVTGARRGGTEL